MFVLKKIKIKKEASTPLTISLVVLGFICILILTNQVSEPNGLPNNRSATNLALMKKGSIYEGKPPSYSGKALRTFKIFKEVLADRESSGKYGIVNKFGYLGKYQFGKSTLDVLGIQNTKDFLRNPTLQEMAFILNVSRNKWILRKEIRHYNGQRINGVLITESGIIAAAHLSGPGNVRTYLRSSGGSNVKDAFGTSLQNYMKNFGGYNISSIPAVKNPRL